MRYASAQHAEQLPLVAQTPAIESSDYLSRHLITYIGNKRALLGQIGKAVQHVKQRLGKNKLRSFDAFSGSGVVSRLLKAHSSYIASNDLEDYATVMSRCFLANQSELDQHVLRECISLLNAQVLEAPFPPGFIEEMYAPRDDSKISKSDRVFYTKKNARLIDNYRRLIDGLPGQMKDFALAPLLSEASIHANTAGVFKGFYKDRDTGIGKFGGTGADALLRILADIQLSQPSLSMFECAYEVFQDDANQVARKVRDIDLAYLDPPYNQHPYGSNYFMLNLITRYERPSEVSAVSGIPIDWNRSGYNVRAESLNLMTDLVDNIDARFLLVSFNNEGFIDPSDMLTMLSKHGKVESFEIKYNAFRGSRSFENRPIHTTEHLFLVEKK